MNKLKRWYNTNRRMIWIAVFTIILIIAVPHAIDNYLKKRKNQSSSNENITTTYGNNNYAVVSDKTLSDETANDNRRVIDSFIDHCNNGRIEEAYNLLTDVCKEKVFPTIYDFEGRYYNRIFNTKRLYEISAWTTNEGYFTYKINFTDDILASGNANGSSIEEYYTVTTENGQKKLNINGFIYNEEINKENEIDELKVKVLSKDIYIEYEIYNIEVDPKIPNAILLDSLESVGTMYVTGSRGLKYNALNHEMVREELRVRGTRIVRVKFNKKHSNRDEIKAITFNDIVLNYEEYISSQNKREYNNRTKIEIEL